MSFEGQSATLESPIILEFKKAVSAASDQPTSIKNFTSYSFESSVLTPASAFRFTAPAVDRAIRLAIRSGDLVQAFVVNQGGMKVPIGTGFVDETDTHITPGNVDYVLSGRDTLGQLVDNAAVDAQNKIINTTQVSLESLFSILLKNTRMPQDFVRQQIPNGPMLFQTTPGETKINLLQRYLEFTNCLVWTQPNGQAVLGKPDFTKPTLGRLVMSSSDPSQNNVLEARSRRNLTHGIRQIVTQLQTMDQVDAGSFTKTNFDTDMRAVRKALVGRSVYRHFSYGSGGDAVNQIRFVGNQGANPRQIGDELSAREIARENMKILDVELVVPGHVNPNGQPYNIDQMYDVQIEDDAVNEPMYVYSCGYELTPEHGMLTRLRLCRKFTICAYGDATPRTAT